MKKYTVTSKTTRAAQGHPELCWMDIRVCNLKHAAGEQANYDFLCLIDEKLYEYSAPAGELLRIFDEKNVNINVRGEKYTFYIEYATGTLYRTISRKPGDEICRLTADAVEELSGPLPCSVERKKKMVREERNGDEEVERALEKLQCSHLPLLIARTSLWATKQEYEACLAKGSPAEKPHIRRKKPGEMRGKQEDGSRLDDNNYPNSQMKASLKARGIIPVDYETCHIWEGTCYDPRYHTCYANLVLLPRAIASLSDHSDNIKAILRYRAFEVFGFKPEGMADPVRPSNYPAESEWQNA